jgi:hypothetical protein
VRKWSNVSFAAQIIFGLVWVMVPESNYKWSGCPKLPPEVRRCQVLKYERRRLRGVENRRAILRACQKALDAIRQNPDVATGFGVAGLSALTIVVLLHKRNVTATPQPPDAGEQDREASERECEEWELKSWDLRSDYRDLMSE